MLAEAVGHDGCKLEERYPNSCEPKRNSDRENDENRAPQPHRPTAARYTKLAPTRFRSL